MARQTQQSPSRRHLERAVNRSVRSETSDYSRTLWFPLRQVYQKYGQNYVGVEPDVEYEYYEPTSHPVTSYMWKTQAGACSVTCGRGIDVSWCYVSLVYF